jgi:putative endonuclease
MGLHIDKGKEGERLACEYLAKRGFEIRMCNWRSGHYEIDVIATLDDIIHFIEVKTRHSLDFGFPEESVTKRKFHNMTTAAMLFLSPYALVPKIQYDILSVLRLPGKPVEFLLIEDVFF